MLLLLLLLMTIVQRLLMRSAMGTGQVSLVVGDTVVSVTAAAVAAIVIVQVTVGGRHQLITSNRTSNIMLMMLMVALRFAFLFHLQLLAKDRGDFALHERPRYRRVRQRTLLTTRTVHLGARALRMDGERRWEVRILL